MKKFLDDDILLNCGAAKTLYGGVRRLPIVDYHCHLDQNKIKADERFADIGELWLAGDHYKWRAMRMCGVDEKYITGEASYHDKFVKYAEIMPMLIGNPLYYWTHFELKRIFGIAEPLNENSAERIYDAANAVLKTLSVRSLLKMFGVEYIATTDDPCDELEAHGVYDGIKVAPTFRPDKAFGLSEDYISKLGKSVGMDIASAQEYLAALVKRLDYFKDKGCAISDHGFEKFPVDYASDAQADLIFKCRKSASPADKDRFFGWLLVELGKEYAKRDIAMQLHFAVIRNNNTEMFSRCGADSGFDLIGEQQSVKHIVGFLNKFSETDRPRIVLYTLNDANLSELAAVTGAFRNVSMGAAWWFNDTAEGIRKNLSVISEYSALGTSLGMLTDSRSFSSYCRFDFFRRILCDYVGGLVEKGECDEAAAIELVKNVCYNNAKSMVGA